MYLVRSKRAYSACYDEYGCFTTAAPFGKEYFAENSMRRWIFLTGGTLQRPFALLPDQVVLWK